MSAQLDFVSEGALASTSRASKPVGQLLKWIGNKQRFAPEIIKSFPSTFGTYHEPFLGSGAVLASLWPASAKASDVFGPLIEIWRALKLSPESVKDWYMMRWKQGLELGWESGYHLVRDSYNSNPNGADLLYLSRACYGGVVRFRKADGFMSTPVGAHRPMPYEKFSRIVDDWHRRVAAVEFRCRDYREAMDDARPGDIIYCDPPYSHSQSILYGAQEFRLADLLNQIAQCKNRGVTVILSIDGIKKSGNHVCDLPIPDGLFEREMFVSTGRSMLRRFQKAGYSLPDEEVSDRLLITE